LKTTAKTIVLAFARNFEVKDNRQTRRLAFRKVLLKYNNKVLDVNTRRRKLPRRNIDVGA